MFLEYNYIHQVAVGCLELAIIIKLSMFTPTNMTVTTNFYTSITHYIQSSF